MPLIIDQLIPKELSEGEHLTIIQVTQNLILEILKLNFNIQTYLVVADWNGTNFYFVAVHRTGKRGAMVIYLISNTPMKSKQYAKLYGHSWKIEKFHRTIKQSLGFSKCFSTKSEVYMNHIKAARLAYCKLQKLIKKFKLNSAEEAIRYIQAQKNILQYTNKHDLISFTEIYA